MSKSSFIKMLSKQKIGRNAACMCGSGKKYKNCCMEMKEMSYPKIGEFNLCSIVKDSLSNISALTENVTKNYKMKSVTFIDGQTICCQYYTDLLGAMDIKVEMYPIIVFIAALVKDNKHVNCNIQQIEVRAFNHSDDEKMYAISRLQSISSDGAGSIEWLKTTYFQENTDDYRLGVAKQKISAIENALRKIIAAELLNKYGNSWWNQCVLKNIREPAENMYQNKYGVASTDGEVLLEHTYLLQLKKIIINNWKDFSSVFVKMNQNQFSLLVDGVNEIRRDEGHNRNISDSALKELTKLYNETMEPIALKYPQVIPKYLADNWMIQVKELIVNHPVVNHFKNHIPTRDLQSNLQFLLAAVEGLNDLGSRLGSITPPPGKMDLHNDVVEAYAKVCQTYEQMIECYKSGDVEGCEKAGRLNRSAFANLHRVRDRIILSL